MHLKVEHQLEAATAAAAAAAGAGWIVVIDPTVCAQTNTQSDAE